MDFDPARGSEQAGVRPAVVISIDSFNRNMPVVVVAAVTKADKYSKIVTVLDPGSPLPLKSHVMPFQVVTVSKDRLEKFYGCLLPAQMNDLKSKMKLVWGLD